MKRLWDSFTCINLKFKDYECKITHDGYTYIC